MADGRRIEWTRADVAPPRELRVAARAHPLAAPGFVVLTRASASTIERTTSWTLCARPRAEEGERLSPDLPERAPETLAHLDDDGVIQVGLAVEAGMVLLGTVAPSTDADDALTQGLGALFGTELSVRDVSVCCPVGVVGEVVSADVKLDALGHPEVRVEIRTTIRARVGDVVEADDGERATVCAALDSLEDGAEMSWVGRRGSSHVSLSASAEHISHARSIGPRSDSSGQPLEGKSLRGGQVIRESHVRALLRAGAVHALTEMFGAKSDDRDGANDLYYAIFGEPVTEEPGEPVAVKRFAWDLRRAGLHAQLEADEIELRLANDFDRTQNAEPLPGLLLHPWALDAAATLLDVDRSVIERVLYDRRTLLGEPAESEADSGANALLTGLGDLDLAQLADSEGERAELARSMRASDTPAHHLVYSSWRTMQHAAPLRGYGLDLRIRRDIAEGFRALDARMLELSHFLADASAPAEARWCAAEELQRALDAIVDGEPGRRRFTILDLPSYRCLRKVVDYSGVAHAVRCTDLREGVVRVSRALALELFRPFVYARLVEDGTCENLRAARQLVDALAPPARRVLDEIVPAYPALVFITAEGSEPHLFASSIELWEEAAIGIGDADWEGLGSGPWHAELHLPVGDAAVREARSLIAGGAGPDLWQAPVGWIARAARAENPASVLFDAALRGEVDPLTDPLTRAFLGRPPLD